MIVYLIRHAHALDADEDAERPLSERGREQVRRMAGLLRANRDLEIHEFWHSPLVRARQTARLFADGLGVKAPLAEVAGLEPDENPRAVIPRIMAAGRPVAVVGHEPHLSALAGLLVTGKGRPFIVFRKCAVLALERMDAGAQGDWAVRWHASPELVGM